MNQSITFINPKLSTANVGDYFIEDSVKKILRFDRDRSIDIDPRKDIDNADIERINRTDVAVIVGTNLWYRQILCPGRWTLSPAHLDKIKVPIIPLGVGTTRHKGEDDAFDKVSLEILQRIHGTCEQGSVRDLRTLEALEKAGIRNAVMTGCPTLFRSLDPDWALNEKTSRKVVVTVRKGQKQNVRRLIAALKAGDWNPVVAAQQEKDNYFRNRIPFIQRPVPTLYEYDIAPYNAFVEESFGAIGWRLHGNMLHLAARNPAVFFANCSRAESFCEAFRLPCFRAEDGEIISAQDIDRAIAYLQDTSIFVPFAERYRHYYLEMSALLEANGLTHNLRVPQLDQER